ncbi:FMN-dependent NADH-azoreductase [Fulvivirga ligni]|uniref:FMN-dependent NADH-azoreductase n=1 Tax=Fulvivirga ligni TaxID=2904246 RepID=UPI001F3D78AB|nr:NAD(P)H-dependent oxidoreductase [Fulvivirga ligni]UII20106.1 NAD(P)H-dependent oxidoreductase [Fulvivirga ligni]
MKTLLRIDCSARTEGSHSRSLADYFEENWRAVNPEAKVKYRDLAMQSLPHIQNKTIEGFFTPQEYMTAELRDALALSDELIEELVTADEVLISSPLYNLNVPSCLKAYLDQVVRIGRTFGMNEKGYYGLLNDKTAHVVTVKGGAYRGTPMEQLDFQEQYLQVILRHMGIVEQNHFSLEGTTDANILKKNELVTKGKIDALFQRQILQTG